MSKISMKICTRLHTILQDESFNNFRVSQLRDAYLAISPTNKDSVEVRKYVYRQILRLVKKGLLLKKGTKNSKRITYQKSDLFHEASFISERKVNKPELTNASTRLAVQQLEKRLKESEVDLLTSIGESEEYMRLYQSFPEMKTHLESQYLQARENSSKLLGQIKAIKSVLAHQQK
ncbi:response regulator [Shewanella sp. 5_MG-2023]|uniref:response regulator n=1 Tax=Shewanella sp. 5_MG-2023 TaxID=3062656 RepID=UPI0026E36C5E|nr:response regulator [Shewanella sp. 5_MG-2023]MDO6642094.1 response regulator [Shewanella sp. 5_MG-2023]